MCVKVLVSKSKLLAIGFASRSVRPVCPWFKEHPQHCAAIEANCPFAQRARDSVVRTYVRSTTVVRYVDQFTVAIHRKQGRILGRAGNKKSAVRYLALGTRQERNKRRSFRYGLRRAEILWIMTARGRERGGVLWPDSSRIFRDDANRKFRGTRNNGAFPRSCKSAGIYRAARNDTINGRPFVRASFLTSGLNPPIFPLSLMPTLLFVSVRASHR